MADALPMPFPSPESEGPLDEAARASSAGRFGYAPIPGPVDRTSFFEEQARHRRSTWRLSALCIAAVVAMGLVVSLIVGPLLLMQLGFVAGVLGLVLPIPDPFWRAVHGYMDLLDLTFQALDGTKPAAAGQLALGLAALFAPGILMMLLIWLALRALFRRDGVGGLLLSLGAREPRPDDLEEHQLVNVVAEMAIAAGLQPPRVVLLDSDVPNAAVVGSSPEDATLVVSRRLLDDFDRDQTQGALGHLIGSIGNGDLRIAFSIVSVYQTLGLFMTLVDAPFSASARSNLLRILRYAFRPAGPEAAREGQTATAQLADTLKESRVDEIGKFIEPDPNSWLGRLDQRLVIIRGIRLAFFMPLLFANLFSKLALYVLLPLLIGPLIALVWRARRYLADATAVQLTRDPNGVARALVELSEKGGVPPGGRWVEHLFVVGTEVAKTRAERSRTQAQLRAITQWARERAGRPMLGNLTETVNSLKSASQQNQPASEDPDQGTFAQEYSILVNFHPSLEKRLKRLRALGATVEP